MIVVFAGPSLQAEDQARFPGLAFRAPAMQGDILRALWDGAEAIGLIDGYFGDRLAPHQKEILEAMAAGIPVVGAASMGALRAAELAPYGMQGVGPIFEGYADGTIECDAEVAVSHGPEELGFVATSIAMVDVRATVAAMEAAGVIGAQRGHDVLAAALDIHFAGRTPESIAEAVGGSEDIAGLFAKHRVEQKRQDAVAMLEVMAAGSLARPEGPPPPMSWYYEAIRARARKQG